MSLYAADGSFNVTVVDGNTLTGIYADDGSLNVFQSDGTTLTGLYHPCGAYNVFVTTNTLTPESHMHPSGCMNVSVAPYVPSVTRVTVVSGAFV